MTKSTIPEILYKYRNWEGESKRILSHNEIYFSSANQFNDPFDASLPYQYSKEELTKENIRKKLFQIGKNQNLKISDEELALEVEKRLNTGYFESGKYKKDFHPQFKEMINKMFGIFSMTKNNADILMWSHYSNSHTGYCLGLDSKLVFNSVAGTIGPVIYAEKFPTIPLFNSGEPVYLLELLTTKSKHWKYEDEFRLIKSLAPRTAFSIPKEAFKEIIFGCKIDPLQRSEILNLVKSKFENIQVFDAKLNDSEFRLDIVPA